MAPHHNIQWSSPLHNVPLLRLVFYSERSCERVVKGLIASQPLTCSSRCYVICICYTSCAPVQEIQSTYVTSNSSPSLCSPERPRARLLCASLAADMGVCSDVKAIPLPRRPPLPHLGHIVMHCKGFLEHTGINLV